nr:hypothetical protein CFP56_02788 [Quercus suber]
MLTERKSKQTKPFFCPYVASAAAVTYEQRSDCQGDDRRAAPTLLLVTSAPSRLRICGKSLWRPRRAHATSQIA